MTKGTTVHDDKLATVGFTNSTNSFENSNTHNNNNGKPESTAPHANKLGTIGLFASLMLLMNTMTGPAMIQVPPIYQQAGFITPTLTFLIIIIISSFSSTCMVEAMSKIPGNENFESRIEFLSLAKYYFNRFGYYLTVILLNINLQANTIACIIASAQTMDYTLVAIFNTACGFEFYPTFGMKCVHVPGDAISVFGSVYILSFGFIVVFLLCLPMGLLNLDDNIWTQALSIIIYIGIVIIWAIIMFFNGLHSSYLNALGTIGGQSQVLGNIMFNFNFSYVVPSWVNQKKKSVNPNVAIWTSTILVGISYLVMGTLGALAFQFPNNEDLLSAINTSSYKPLAAIAMISVYVFPIPTFLSGVPVNSIIVKYNLIENKICGKVFANFFAVILPWLIAVPFYTGSGLSVVCNWSSLLCGAVICYIIPFIFYLIAVRVKKSKKLNPEYYYRATHVISSEDSKLLRNDSSNDSNDGQYQKTFEEISLSYREQEKVSTKSKKIFKAFPNIKGFSWGPILLVIAMTFFMFIANIIVVIQNLYTTIQSLIAEYKH